MRAWARRFPSLLAVTAAAVVAGLAGAAVDVPAPASSWIDTVNWYRSMAHVAPVVEEPAWSDGLAHHLTYLRDTPANLKTGAYASAHTENPASPAHSADGAGSDGGGYVTVWPCGAPRPNASNLNVANADTRPNLVVGKVGNGGRICLYTSSATHLVVDFQGWFAG